jgi:hypothetical protein
LKAKLRDAAIVLVPSTSGPVPLLLLLLLLCNVS